MSVRKGSSTVASRLLVKVISVPSGDHAGPMSSLGWLVRLVSPLPSRFTAQISHGSQQPPTWLCFMNTTFVLSGRVHRNDLRPAVPDPRKRYLGAIGRPGGVDLARV